MNKKYYDGFIVHDILDKHLDAKKMMEVLKAFAEVKGVDAVEVVRCKDCKWFSPGNDKVCSICNRLTKKGLHPDDFCSMAVKKVVRKDPHCSDETL